MKLVPAGGALLLMAVATSLAASFPGQPQAPQGESTRKLPGRAKRSADTGANRRKIPCKTPENAPLCYWTHGRLSIYNGNPTYRIWKIDAHRIVGIFNGPSHFPPRTTADDESPDLPGDLESVYEVDHQRWKNSPEDMYYAFPDVFADFEVCPLEPETRGWMQAVCVESAKHIFVQSYNK